MKSRIGLLIASVLLSLGIFVPAPAAADELEITVRSDYEYTVQLKFFSRTRSHVWPSASTSWVLNDYNEHTFSMTCMSGEKICLGAWNVLSGNVTGSTYWGVGTGRQGCTKCCFTCGDGPYKTQVLNDSYD